MPGEDHQNNGAVHQTVTLNMRLPEFVSSDCEMWFAMVESNFIKSGITDSQQRYLNVLAVLPSRYTKDVRDIIMKPLSDNSYDNLKSELIKRLSSSQEEKTRQLLQNVTMGEERPSHFLRRLQSLAGEDVPENLLKTLWLRGLPQAFQATMATQKDKSLADMAEVADAVYEISHARTPVMEVAAAPDSQLVLQFKQLQLEMAALKTQLSAVIGHVSEISNKTSEPNYRSRYGRSRSNSNTRARSRSPSASRDSRLSGLCWYHYRFKGDARKCVQPCSWSSENREGSH